MNIQLCEEKKLYFGYCEKCQIVIGWKIPGDQSSQSLLCQGGRRLAPEAHSQAQLPAQDQSIVNVHKQIYINIYRFLLL